MLDNTLLDAFRLAPNPFVLLDRDLRLVWMNEAYLDVTGRTRDDLIGQKMMEAFPSDPDSLPHKMLTGSFAKVLETGKRDDLPEIPYAIPNADGTFEDRYWSATHTPLLGPDGAVTHILQQTNDVTERRLLEEAARASEARFQSMAQSMPNHVWTAAADGALDWINDQIVAYSGKPGEELYGGAWASIIHPEDQDMAIKAWMHAIETGTPYEIEFRVRRGDGEYRWFLVRGMPMRAADGRVTRWIGTNTDIHARYEAEAALADLNATLEERVEERSRALQAAQDDLRQAQKMESIGNLAGGISHDFNNILQVITGSLHLLERELGEDFASRDMLDHAKQAVARGKALAGQMLSFSRRQTLDPKVIHLGQQAEQLRPIVRSAIGDGISLDITYPENLWHAHVDATNVENCLLNLAINARDAMNGHGKLAIAFDNVTIDGASPQTPSHLPSGDYVTLSVQDTGCGIAPDVLNKVFEPFFTTKDDGHGTGLGLSMVYGFVKQSNGDISIASQVGEGTTICIYLPRSEEPLTVAASEAAAEAIGGEECVLVVEDDASLREITTETLKRWGYRVIAAADADAAARILSSDEVVDIVFSDVVMPGPMKSTELAELAARRIPPVPLLFTSGYARDMMSENGQIRPEFNLLHKPYEEAELAVRLRQVLDGQSASQTGKPKDDLLAGQTVLVCEDEALIAMDMSATLGDAGCTVQVARNGAMARSLTQEALPDILVCDFNLPDIKGDALASELRENLPDLPVLFVTGDSAIRSKVDLPRAGFLDKPFTKDALLAAISTVLDDG